MRKMRLSEANSIRHRRIPSSSATVEDCMTQHDKGSLDSRASRARGPFMPTPGWLFVGTLGLCVVAVCCWIVIRAEQYHSRRDLIDDLGGRARGRITAPEWVIDRIPETPADRYVAAFATDTEIHLTDASVTDEDLAALRDLADLETLHLDQTEIGDAGLQRLGELPKLSMLTLSDTKVTDAGLEYVSRFESLQCLHLSNTAISDSGIARLSSLKGLHTLRLDNTGVSDAGLTALIELRELQTLSLQGTTVTDMGILRLRTLKSLEYLHVEDTHVTFDGADALRLHLGRCFVLARPLGDEESW